MADAGVLPASRAERAMERMKMTAGVLAAVAGAITGMWTIYEKVKTDSRQYTAASYETLAPQVNQLNEALRKLEEDNQQLKKALLATHAEQRQHSGKSPRVTARTEPAPAVPPAAPPATAPPAAGTPAPSTPEERSDDALGRIVGTVNATREAVEAVRKVPETFQQVLESKGKK